MEKFIENLDRASKLLQTADHLLYITYPIVKEKRLLLKILNEVNVVVMSIINAILQYEYLYKRIDLYKDAKVNFQVFKDKCAPRFKIDRVQIAKILEIFNLAEKHKKSPFEFVKDDKVVIMTNSFKTDIITTEKMKEYIFISKDLLRKAELVILPANERKV